MKLWLDILRDVYADAGRRLWLLLVLLVVTGLSDGISMALLYPLLDLLGMGQSVQTSQGAVGSAFRRAADWLGVQPTLTFVSSVLIGSFCVQALLSTGQSWVLTDIQKKYVASWQNRLVSSFISAEWTYFVAQKQGELANLVLVECPRLGAAFFAILQLSVAAVVLCVYLTLAVIVSWKVTLYLAVAALILFLLVHPIRTATRRYGAELGQINADVATTLNEILGGAKVIKASAGEPKALSFAAEQIRRLRDNLTWSAFLPTTIRSGFEFAAILMILGAVIYGLKIEHVSPAQLLVIVALVARLFPRLMHIQQFHNIVNLCAPAYGQLQGRYRQFTAHGEAERMSGRKQVDLDRLLPAAIEVDRMIMRYGERNALDGVSFAIPAGQVVGFIGRSGAGKSTLVDALIGLVELTEGEVRIGGQPLRDIDLAAWRRRIGYVSQDTFLFHDTIGNNIRWSVSDASMEQVESVARIAGLAPFIASLPDGYDTIVGDRGAKLSGGQRQRISLARALIRQPAVLVLDEPTSALDSVSEQEVMSVIHSLRGTMTIIIVTHRLSTVREADCIYVLEDGRMVEQGSWASLSGRKALFHQLLTSQAVAGSS